MCKINLQSGTLDIVVCSYVRNTHTSGTPEPLSVHMLEILTFRNTGFRVPFMWRDTYIPEHMVLLSVHMLDAFTSGTPATLSVHMEEILAFRNTWSLCIHMKDILTFRNTWSRRPCISKICIHFPNTWSRCPFIFMRYLHFRNTWNRCPFMWRDT